VNQGKAMPKSKRKNKLKRIAPGPKPDTLKFDGNWKDAVKKSLGKRRPPEGWPKK
jgi:hypothetical protein